MPASGPEPIQIALELGGALRPLARSPAIPELERDIAAQLSDLMLELGIEGRVGVATFPADDERALRVRVEGWEIPYPSSLLWRVWLALAGRLDAPLPASTDADDGYDGWLQAWVSEGHGEPAPGLTFDVMAFLAELSTAVVAQHPGCLLADDTGTAEAPASLLRRLLDLGISIRDRSCIEGIAAMGHALGLSEEDVVEAALAELRPQRIELVSPTAVPVDGLRPFLELFYAAYGIWAPEVELTTTSAATGTAVRVNHRRPIPVPVLPTGKVLLPVDPVDMAALGIDCAPALNPLHGTPASIVSTEDAASAPAQAFGPTEIAGIALYHALAEDPGALLCLRHVERALVFVQTALGDLVQATLERVSICTLTRTLRALVRDGISIRNLRAILDRIVRYRAIQVSAPDTRVLSDGLPLTAGDPRLDQPPGSPELLAFVRLGLFDEIRAQLPGLPVAAISVAAPLEARLAAGSRRPLSVEEQQELRDAAARAAAMGGHAVVTSLEARAELGAMLGPVLQGLPVLAAPELHDAPVIEVATLGLATEPHVPASPTRARAAAESRSRSAS